MIRRPHLLAVLSAIVGAPSFCDGFQSTTTTIAPRQRQPVSSSPVPQTLSPPLELFSHNVHGNVYENDDNNDNINQSGVLESHKKKVSQSERKTSNLLSRRDWGRGTLQQAVGASIIAATATTSAGIEPAWAADDSTTPVPAKRATAYRVDSTQPPTLIPLSSARQENQVLQGLGKGLGTDKEAIVDDRVNLNNVLNKLVFGTADAVKGVVGSGQKDESMDTSGPGYASFVCLGVPAATTETDIDLVQSLLQPILLGGSAKNNNEKAIGLASFPVSVQSDLDTYLESSGGGSDKDASPMLSILSQKSGIDETTLQTSYLPSEDGDEGRLLSALSKKSGVPESDLRNYLPLMRFAKLYSFALLAMAPEKEDVATARKQGLQFIDPSRRSSYVVDPDGFIALSQNPKFRVYTERSLLKDYYDPAFGGTPPADDKAGNFFSERILVHETAATVAAQWAMARPGSLMAIVAPIPDVRFLQGINGRIPRVCEKVWGKLGPTSSSCKVTDNAVTTILLNPTAKETLSKSRFLRLEIGTGPETLDYQAKVADYLWFSAPPKVNLIPRLMNG